MITKEAVKISTKWFRKYLLIKLQLILQSENTFAARRNAVNFFKGYLLR